MKIVFNASSKLNSKLVIVVCLVGLILLFSTNDSISYEGRGLNAEWRKQANQNIEKYRKADLRITVFDRHGSKANGAQLQVRMIRHAFAFGSAVGAKQMTKADEDFTHYRYIVDKQYNKVVLENDLKWDQWNPSKTNPPGHGYYYPQTFAALQWLKDHNIEVRGHYVSWGPVERFDAYKKYKAYPEVFRQVLFEHIREEVPAVGNLVAEWDGINHPIGWNEKLITLADMFGREIYVDILKLARELNPQASLYVNEGNILPSGKFSELMRDKYERCIRNLIDSGAPLDGIGFMGHFTQKRLTAPTELYRILGRFAALGLPLQVTEFDLRFADPEEYYNFSNAELQLQADYTRDFMTVMFSHPAVVGIIMWGFWEGHHYHPSAALYRKDWSIKPNGTVWYDLVFRKWWTDEHGQTDQNGKFGTRGFLGDYEIIVEYQGKSISRFIKLTKDGRDVDIAL